jgi:glycosyltransferase involved in cell wall biosynthesis
MILQRSKISVLVPTFNNAPILRECLRSVKWADEILAVDSFSSDGTLEICHEYGARVIQHEYVQSAIQKNWAIPQCAYDWVLQIDTDERLEEGAREEILDAIVHADSGTDAFRLPRKNHILDQWLVVENLYPDFQTRLFRRDRGSFENKEVHAHVQVPGKVQTLTHHILHYGMETISKQLTNIDRYSRYQADELKKRGKKFHWYQLFLRPVAIFGYYYLWKRGFTAGYRGYLISTLNATFDFWTHAKLWEIEKFSLEASPK